MSNSTTTKVPPSPATSISADEMASWSPQSSAATLFNATRHFMAETLDAYSGYTTVTYTQNSTPPAIYYPHIHAKLPQDNYPPGAIGNFSSTTQQPLHNLSLAMTAAADFGQSSDANTPVMASVLGNIVNATLTTLGTALTTSMATNATYDNGGIVNATETPYVPYVMRPETYIVPVLFAFIFIVGVLGNGTLIIVFLTVRQMRNVPNTYIFSLALADLLVIVTTVPLTSTVYTVDSWPWGKLLCTLSEFFKDVSIGVSVFTLTALSGDRYFAIVDPLRKFHAHGGGKRATRMTIAIAIAIWLLAIVCGLPALIGTYIKEVVVNSNKSFALCYPFPERWGWEYAKTMVLLRFLVYYAIPLVIIGVFYVLIARHLMYAANVPGEMQGAVRQVRARRKVALTVLAFVVIFGICFLPIHVFMLWFYYWPTALEDYNSFWHVLRIVGFCMSFANSCANPVALYFVSGAFRKHFNRYLFCEGSRTKHKKRNDTMCMHRDTSLTSTASKRYYHSRRSCFNQSTIRRLQETTITMLTNGNPNGCGNCPGTNVGTGNGPNCPPDDSIEVALASEYCHQHQHQHQLM
ncbi:neuropeptide CCHamide-1 receptor isoform X2 [Stomoxys calcitrans]|uniref:G-protein coupled receptors family 1 profile domain-containing protein n=1 Tax=Stomoxys calcitrans TaxID=35570 RepID=A0A1I8PFK0_STOCA|nr:neuropeptide CCHamide-1 receptor isoform X2 [Stomoxys calcitrans]